VQVTRDGQCVVLGVDGQSIGGYPKIAQVISADLDLLGQLRPGDRVFFVRVDMAEAEVLRRRRAAALRQWVVRLLETTDLIAGHAAIGLAHRHEPVTSANNANFPENLT
jgi:allophanate hydrolase subunit 2